MSAPAQRLIGTWRLAGWHRIGADGTRTEPLGPGATGLIAYTADGFMFATLTAPNRAPFAGGDPFGGTAEECRGAMATGLSYCGRWRVDGETLVHTVELSMFPNWAGIEMVRTLRFEGESAVVRTPPVDSDGGPVVFELVLRRAA
jgi:hypothetical protein